MVIPALIGAAAAIGGSLLAANASGNAASSAAASNQANINFQSGQNFLERQFAERILGIQLSPTEDAFGNRTTFTPGVGFKATAAPAVKALQDASIREQQQQLTVDAPRQRRGREETAERGRAEGGVADALLQQFVRALQNPQSASELFRILLAQGNQGFQGEVDRQQQNALRQDLRSGGGSGGKLLAEFARVSAEGRGDRAASAKLQSITGADEINFSRLGNISGLENLFAQRAQNSTGNVAFAPEQLSSLASGLALNQRQGALGASQIAGALNQNRAPQSVPQAADFGSAAAFAGIGNALSGLFEKLSQPAATPTLRDSQRSLGNSFSGNQVGKGGGFG